VVPQALLDESPGLLPACQGVQPPGGRWCHVAAADLVRLPDGQLYVRADQLGCPVGIARTLEHRQVLKRTLPAAFASVRLRPIDGFPGRLLEQLEGLAPHRGLAASEDLDGSPIGPEVVLLGAGLNSANADEHALLARQLGIERVEDRDLIVDGGACHMRTTRGLRRVDIIYRALGDELLDPVLGAGRGVAGLFEVWRQGGVAICNAPGTAIAEDRALFPLVPALIQHFLGEAPILPQLPTLACRDPGSCQQIVDQLATLAVWPRHGSDVFWGPSATVAERTRMAAVLQAQPHAWIAQPAVQGSLAPTVGHDATLEPRPVELRVFALQGTDVYVLPGGLTRVTEQGVPGIGKDTWVLAEHVAQ